MRIELQPAFVLHRRPYRNTSLLVDVLSRDHGRISMVARGARGPRSRLKAVLQPFLPLLLSWSGRGELSNLTTAEATGPTVRIPAKRLLSGFYINELLLRLLQPHDPYPLFDDYHQTLQDLAEFEYEEPVLRIFEKRLLAELGYGLLLDSEAPGNNPIEPTKRYRYILEQGPIAVEGDGAGITLSGKALLALHSESFDDSSVLREVKRLTRAALEMRLQGRPLKTRTLLMAEYHRRRGKTAHGV
ncbi:MAG: DNA repair protein RecO [Candidatus Competibacteraceae bacterium]|jgi:DNA repair protein RecO (recombination protein O)|nr:DNA repair protein RecO [Candidatus Competibacteraceae bacterium]